MPSTKEGRCYTMTDLEKRAHDLAVAYAQTETIKNLINPETGVCLDDEYTFFDFYKENYPIFMDYLKDL